MKFFVSNSTMSIILKILLLTFPICVFVSFFVQTFDYELFIFEICIAIVLDLGFFLLLFSLFGLIVIKRDIIIVSQDCAIKPFRIQHKLKVKIDDITAIEFLEEDCTSIGSKIRWRYFGTPSFLKIYKKDNSIERIFLGKYSFNTWRKIEKLIIERNSGVIVLTDASAFKNYLKTGKNGKSK